MTFHLPNPRFKLLTFQNLTKNTDIVHNVIKILSCCYLQPLTLPFPTLSLSPIKYVYRIYMWDYTPSRLVVIDYSWIYKSLRHHIGLHKWFDDQFVDPVWYRIHFTWWIQSLHTRTSFWQLWTIRVTLTKEVSVRKTTKTMKFYLITSDQNKLLVRQHKRSITQHTKTVKLTSFNTHLFLSGALSTVHGLYFPLSANSTTSSIFSSIAAHCSLSNSLRCWIPVWICFKMTKLSSTLWYGEYWWGEFEYL